MWQFFSYIWWFPYFFLTFDGSILTLCSSNMWQFFSHIWWFPYFFFSHLTVPSSHCVVPTSRVIPTSHVIVLLSHWVVPLLFSHTWRFHPHIVQFHHHMWQFFSHIWWFLYFFLTFDDSIVTLSSTNIASDSIFYLLITAHHNSNFFKVIKKFRSKIENQKKKKSIPWN